MARIHRILNVEKKKISVKVNNFESSSCLFHTFSAKTRKIWESPVEFCRACLSHSSIRKLITSLKIKYSPYHLRDVKKIKLNVY